MPHPPRRLPLPCTMPCRGFGECSRYGSCSLRNVQLRQLKRCTKRRLNIFLFIFRHDSHQRPSQPFSHGRPANQSLPPRTAHGHPPRDFWCKEICLAPQKLTHLAITSHPLLTPHMPIYLEGSTNWCPKCILRRFFVSVNHFCCTPQKSFRRL